MITVFLLVSLTISEVDVAADEVPKYMTRAVSFIKTMRRLLAYFSRNPASKSRMLLFLEPTSAKSARSAAVTASLSASMLCELAEGVETVGMMMIARC